MHTNVKWNAFICCMRTHSPGGMSSERKNFILSHLVTLGIDEKLNSTFYLKSLLFALVRHHLYEVFFSLDLCCRHRSFIASNQEISMMLRPLFIHWSSFVYIYNVCWSKMQKCFSFFSHPVYKWGGKNSENLIWKLCNIKIRLRLIVIRVGR